MQYFLQWNVKYRDTTKSYKNNDQFENCAEQAGCEAVQQSSSWWLMCSCSVAVCVFVILR